MMKISPALPMEITIVNDDRSVHERQHLNK